MRRTLQAADPEEFILAMGRGYTVREFAQTAFDHAVNPSASPATR